MERIKQAVEMARRQREVNTRVDGKGPAHSVSLKSVSMNSIEYTNTRRMEIPSQVFEKNRLVSGIDDDAVTTAYKVFRTHVARLLSENNWNAMAITSPRQNEGKTLTAVNLTISLAREVNKTVLLVDADFKNPSICPYLDIKPQYGLKDYLLNDVPLSQILINPGIERLVVLPSIEPMANSSEVISSPKMAQLIEELKSRYPSRIVIFDLPPLLVTEDSLAFAPLVDAALLVIEDGKTTADEIQRSMELLRATNVLGTVLNKTRKSKSTYNYA